MTPGTFFSANVLSSVEKNLHSKSSASPYLRPEMDQKTKKSAYVKIVEQPASKGLRFRYECEGRWAHGSRTVKQF